MPLSDFKEFDIHDALYRNSKRKIKSAPSFAGKIQIADTHCHLSMLKRPAFAIARAAVHHVDFLCAMVDPADSADAADEESSMLISARDTYEQLSSWLDEACAELARILACDQTLSSQKPFCLPRIRIAAGVHPHNAKHYAEVLSELKDLLADPLTCCLGEIGLDYHYDLSPRETQREVFAAQLELAMDAGLPVSLHLREAHDDALAILRECGLPEAGCILHCFNLGPETLAPFLEMGCMVAFGGPLTFRKAYYTRRACLDVPVRRLLTETDAPFMAPEPLRGTVCMPDMTLFTLRCLLDCFAWRGVSRAIELCEPRDVDLERGASRYTFDTKRFDVLGDTYTEQSFGQIIYQNAIELLDRQPTAWQREHARKGA